MLSDRISVGGDINILRTNVSILNMTFLKNFNSVLQWNQEKEGEREAKDREKKTTNDKMVFTQNN